MEWTHLLLIVMMVGLFFLLWERSGIALDHQRLIQAMKVREKNPQGLSPLRNFMPACRELGVSFNEMITQTQLEQSRQADQIERLTAVLKSTSHGILALDMQEKVLLINRAARLIFDAGQEVAYGTPLEQVIGDTAVLKMLQNIILQRQSAQEQLFMGDQIYRVKADPIRLDPDHGDFIGCILNIEDITRKVRSDQFRSEFVANVTHELKTPLTSINGFVETLKTEEHLDKKTTLRFLNIIEMEANRLRRLIEDILTLSFIENEPQSGLPTEVDLPEVIRDCIHLLQRSLREKKMTVNIHASHKSVRLLADEDMLRQLFINLIDNAIKYSEENSAVYVNILDNGSSILVSVRDNGIGIPQADLSRIFERFYRVDKARSKKAGGTGLGLAIAKHIVLSLEGSIKVKSQAGQGSEFIIDLPRRRRT